MKFKRNDEVLVMRGSDKGKKGTILKVDTAGNKVLVSGINMVVKHVKPRAGKPGERVEREAFVSASNVMHLDPESGKPTRVAMHMEGKKKVRVAVKSKKPLGAAKAPKPKATTKK